MDAMFETAHLRVRPFDADDALYLYKNHQEAEVKKWIPNECYTDPEEAQNAIKFYVHCVSSRQLPYVLAVELKETGELIGDTGANQVEGNPSEVEIGYTICKKHSGKGYATELVASMTEYIAATFGICTLYGRVIRGNLASMKVLEKNGYVLIGEETDAEDDPYGNGMLVYRKTQ